MQVRAFYAQLAASAICITTYTHNCGGGVQLIKTDRLEMTDSNGLDLGGIVIT